MTPNEIDLVSIALIAVETNEPVDNVAARFGDDVVVDDIGMRSVPATVAADFFARRARAAERRKQLLAERFAAASKSPAPVGVPAVDGLSAIETMMAADDFQTPSEEFGMVRKPNFLADELAAGQRHLVEAQKAARRKGKE